jgi:hypothetical protein
VFHSNFTVENFQIVNNAFVENNIGINSVENRIPHIKYNDFYMNGNDWVGLSALDTNLYVDPKFVDKENLNFNLDSTSLLIDSGDPQAPEDLDHTRSDIGAIPYLQVPMMTKLVYPEDLAVNVPNDTTLIWNSSPRTDLYRIMISTNDDFESPLVNAQISDTTYALEGITIDTVLYWKVQCMNIGGQVNGLIFRSFGLFDPTLILQNDSEIPLSYKIHQNYPNPFNPTTSISYALPKESHVKLVVYNNLGQIVQTLVNEYQQAGYYNIKFNGINLSSGLYFYRLSAKGEKYFEEIKKMILIK